MLKRLKLLGMLLGLSVCLAGQAAAEGPYRWSPVTIKGNGFIDGISYSPAARDTFFINTDMGGAYRWDNTSRCWACMTDWARFDDPSAKNMGVETLAVDPSNAGRVYMAVGTYMSPTALMRSEDGGRTFERTNTPFKSNGNGSARNTGQRMVVDPNASNVLYYGTRVDGLWASQDAAKTWHRVGSFPTIGHNAGRGRDTGLLFVHIDRTSAGPNHASQVIYVGVFETDAGKPRLYRSSDGGNTWADLPGGQPTDANLFPQRMALTPDGKTAYVTFATFKEYPGPYGVLEGRVMKITGPATASPKWTDVTPPSKKPAYSGVALDPSYPAIVYVTELGNYNPADRIWRSLDSGGSWKVISPNGHRDDSSAPYAASSNVHWMGDLEIDPFDRNTAMFSTGYGLYRTTNLSASEPTWAFFNDGFEQSAVLEFATPYDGPVHLISAIGDRDGYRHVDFTRSPAETLGRSQGLSRGSCDDIDVARRDSNQLVRVVNTTPYVQYSSDNGVSWHWFGDPPAGVGKGGSVAIAANGRRVTWRPAGTTDVYFADRTENAWGLWQKGACDVALPRNAVLTADLNADATFYLVGDGQAFRSDDGGATWKRVSEQAPNPNRMRAVPDHTGHLWACGFGDTGLWRSIDGGASWTRWEEKQMPVAYVVGVGAAKAPGGYPALYIGGSVNGVSGIFRSDDEGRTWTEISDPQHQFGSLTTIQGDPRVWGRVYLGTNGRGIVCGDIASAAP